MYKFVSKNIMDDAVAFSWFNAKKAFYKALFVYCFVTVAACVSIFSDFKDWKNLILVFVILISGLFFISFYKMIKKSPLKNGHLKKTLEVIITFDNEKVSSKTIYNDGESTGECNYDRFIKIREDKDRIYCYLDANSALILNKKSVDNIDEFKNFLRRKVNIGIQ